MKSVNSLIEDWIEARKEFSTLRKAGFIDEKVEFIVSGDSDRLMKPIRPFAPHGWNKKI